MNVGYNPVRQPLRVAPPVNLPSNYNMAGFNADINANARIASTLNAFAPSLMQLGVKLKLDDENRLGYTKELQARSQADHSAFQATIAEETAKLTTNISTMNDKDGMDDVINLNLEGLRGKVTGTNGETPLIRDKKQQQQYLEYINNVVRPHWKSTAYARVASLDAQDTKAKADLVIEQGVDLYDKDKINEGVQIKLDAGQLTPEQAKLEIHDKTLKAQEMDLNRVVSLVNSGDRFTYLQILGMSEEDAERNGYSTSELAEMSKDKLVKDRIDKGMYDLISDDDIGIAKANMDTGVAAIETRQETAIISAQNREMKKRKDISYRGLDGLLTNPAGFYNLTPDQQAGYTSMIVPGLSKGEVETAINQHVKVANKGLGKDGYRRYNKLTLEAANYNSSNDKDGSKFGEIYMGALMLPNKQMYYVLSHLRNAAFGISTGKVTSNQKKLLYNEIHRKFNEVSKKGWMGKKVKDGITFLGDKKNIHEAEAEFLADFDQYVADRDMTYEEARDFLKASPILNNLDNYQSMQNYEANLRLMTDPNSNRSSTVLPY